MDDRDSTRSLPLNLSGLQWVGVAGIFLSLLIWLFTTREVPTALISAFGGMLAVEEGRKAVQEVTRR